MKISTSLFEKRSHPELNPKLSGWDVLNQYKDDPSILISFTKIEKLGVNPQTEYDTPAGVYFYPLKIAWEHYRMDTKENVPLKNIFPFAAENPYIHIIRVDSSKCLTVSKYTEEDYKKDFDTLHKYFIPNDEAANAVSYKYGSFHPRMSMNPAARLIHSVLYFYYSAQREGALVVLKGQVFKKKSTFSTFCLKKILGYTGVIDDANEGAIHQNEPIQAVLFDPHIIRRIRTVPNTLPVKYTQEDGVVVRFIAGAITQIDRANMHPLDMTDKEISGVYSYKRAKITERIIELVRERLGDGLSLSPYGRHIVNKVLASDQFVDSVEGRTVQEFALGWITPYVLVETAMPLSSQIKSIKSLNMLFDICTLKECHLTSQNLYKYNILHLIARMKAIGVLRAAITTPHILGAPVLSTEMWLDTEYHDRTPFQILYEHHKKEAEEFLAFIKAMRPLAFIEHPEAFKPPLFQPEDEPYGT